jgi:hypothetical protein
MRVNIPALAAHRNEEKALVDGVDEDLRAYGNN